MWPITLQAAGRHQCSYLITLQKQEFILQGGDQAWLKGLGHIPQKLRNLYDINKILAHQPWLLKTSHIKVSMLVLWFCFCRRWVGQSSRKLVIDLSGCRDLVAFTPFPAPLSRDRVLFFWLLLARIEDGSARGISGFSSVFFEMLIHLKTHSFCRNIVW